MVTYEQFKEIYSHLEERAVIAFAHAWDIKRGYGDKNKYKLESFDAEDVTFSAYQSGETDNYYFATELLFLSDEGLADWHRIEKEKQLALEEERKEQERKRKEDIAANAIKARYKMYQQLKKEFEKE